MCEMLKNQTFLTNDPNKYKVVCVNTNLRTIGGAYINFYRVEMNLKFVFGDVDAVDHELNAAWIARARKHPNHV